VTDALWSWEELIAAAGAIAEGGAGGPVTGFSIDTRTLQPGDVFVALKDARDGHDFVSTAFAAGASAALVRHDYQRQANDGALLRVDDPLCALERTAAAARARLSAHARVVAVTGSAGKTTTKEMFRASFEALAPGAVHASAKSYNNHWGVPLTLARMPQDTRYAVFEIGMNHAGEIRPLTKMVRPHLAVITSILPVHIGNFPDGIAGIARAKAEIFEGLGRTSDDIAYAVVPAESAHLDALCQAALAAAGLQRHNRGNRFGLYTFGRTNTADVQINANQSRFDASGSDVALAGQLKGTARVAVPGSHNADNAAAVLLASHLLERTRSERGEHSTDAAWKIAANALNTLKLAPQGRGQASELADAITLVDESYNANPASVRAALETLSFHAPERRRICVLGDMLELGEHAMALHVGLADAVVSANATLFCCGPMMRYLFDAVPKTNRGGWAPSSKELTPVLLDALRFGDVVMVKGSLGSRMAVLTDAVKDRYAIASNPGPDPS